MQSLTNLLFFILLLCNGIFSLSDETENASYRWPSKREEVLDEINDAQILKAVQDSMKEYNVKISKNKRAKRSTKRVCYDELGCFEDSGPFSYLEMLPSHPEDINTKFFFYSAKKRTERPLFQIPWKNISEAFTPKTSVNDGTTEDPTPFSKTSFTLDDLTGFDELQTKVIVHGFGSACPHVWIYEMKTALMAVENCIVICVDWENGATLPNYVRAATNTRLVGKQLAMLLKNLNKHKGLDYSKTHIIGFSLGAHVAGFAGAELPGLNRITGLDPAGPLFESQHPKVRLDSTDAAFVDVIHSNGENLILGGLGSWQPMGHVDFYPNGGRVQTGCSNLFVGAVTDFIWSQAAEVEGRSLCNHRRAYKFFIDSVAPRCLFPAFACTSYDDFLEGNCFPCDLLQSRYNSNISICGNMGYYANKSTGKGQLYLLTREEEPFCAHQFKLQIFNSINDLPLRTIGKIEATLEGEGGLNETFLITEKEDTEFFAGQKISKIIVPHPALGFPSTLILQYKSYSGWLSKGLPHWDIDKIALTDSFGRTLSLCSPLLSLKSGIPVTFKLQPNDCELPKSIEISTASLNLSSEQSNEKVPGKYFEENILDKNKIKNDILTLGANYAIEEKSDQKNYHSSHENNNLLYQPLQEGSNDLDKENIEQSRSLRSPEIFEPVLKSSSTYQKGRNLHSFENDSEIKEPILKATTPKLNKNSGEEKQIEQKTETESNRSEGDVITIQIFPFKIGELFERAERYARETILPIFSEQAPKLLGFIMDKKEGERKPRFIKEYDKGFKNVQKSDIQNNGEIGYKTNTQISPKFNFMNYRALKANDRSDLDVSETIQIGSFVPVHIDLPTYRPNIF
ncbi:uncharacterized protein LOC129614431 [Condylostylus longicornis]|uniref:uncharacterized protein LOC129614431 n=1 Tax=Condylostylus longicornis TaxID=2530218 RepID=UPI00244DE237|nr:uncharacterized protein LOC129614431 [Condylostylus longicornis]XP_055384999.1 uncharacterized protein LOC129614431 [Condylostylus longicornis]XP_055385000.1 uncharacterized protein LOC129614431 [Condylostylus longicornis]XP_055385001.1 uncharacterized protein LOC129614431 [Condylostylus longicornis]